LTGSEAASSFGAASCTKGFAQNMPDREEIAARLAAAVLQSTPEPPGKRPGQAPDMIATCRYAVALYETILGMLPEAQPNKLAESGVMARRTGPGQRARDESA
jgi:hypothetical protein